MNWNLTDADYPHDRCIHHLFEEQVARTPDAVAVVFEQQQISYADLNARANQLAHYLRKLGVGPEVLVGFCLERSLDLMVGVLGILKAGGAYVPLDPTYPAERLAFMLADTQVTVVITQAALDRREPWFLVDGPWSIVRLDADWPQIAQQPATNPTVMVTPDNLTYVIYTSGSTGQPKGVQIVHRALVNLVTSMRHQPGMNASDVLLAITTVSFDMAGVDLFLPLCVGACMVLGSHGIAGDGTRLRQILDTTPITFMQATPVTWRMLLLAGWTGNPRLKALCGGEALPPDLARQLAGCVGQLWNMYGPTETTIWSALELIQPDPDTITIGRPIANTQFYILDPQRQPVPIGVTGEIAIGGVGMARGYLNRPELTAERFVANPFGSGRLYQTGDMARYRPDGRIEVLGRSDHQVKVRGFRIELGEIEAVLSQHPDVQQAVVVARDAGLETRLVAYLVGAASDPATLRTYLATRLPDYMLPAAFVSLDSLPLTPNGKIDRQALPAPQAANLAHAAYTAPQTPIQQTLVAIWQEVLGVDQVGIHDNFFALGGHSLLALRLSHAIQATLGQALPLVALFQHPTVADLSRRLDGTERSDHLPIALLDDQSTQFALAYGQQALWFLHQSAPQSSAYNSGMAVSLPVPLNEPALHQALHALLDRHPLLRATITVIDHQPVQVVRAALDVPLEIIDSSGWHADERRQQIAALFARPFDLTQGVCRTTLITHASEHPVLLLAIHHLATDAGSNDILMRDLAALYRAVVTGHPADLPSLHATYAAYVRWEADLLRHEGDRLRAYWHNHLAGDLPVLALPTDRPRPPVQSFTGAVYATTLDANLTQQLKTLARQHQVTLFTLLLAAYQVLLHRLTGQTDILVGTAPEAGRSRPEFADVVGYFVNPLVLRATIDPTTPPAFTTILAQAHQTVQAALDHQHYPFPLLVQEVLPHRDASIPPLIQTIVLLYQRQTRTAEPAAGQIMPYPFDATDGHGAGQFDLALLIADQGDTFELVWDYTPDLFDASTIIRLAGHFTSLLHGIVATPNQSIATLPLLSHAERQQLLETWNATTVAYPHNQGVHQLIEAQVARTPNAVAVICEQQQISYADLNARANQLAHYLRKLGVGPEVRVGLCLARSIELMVGVLGILKAGGAYVPLDPTYPIDRLAFILADTHATVVITQATLDRGPEWATVDGPWSLVRLDTDWPQITQEPVTNPTVMVTPDNLAYLIYTSGSTGTPNGVQVTHRSLVNHNWAIVRHCDITAQDRILQFASISFDASAEEIFPCWLSGATLVLRSEAALASFQAFHRFIEQHALTILDLPTAYWHAWVDHLRREPVALPGTLRLVIIGGEPARAEQYAVWRTLTVGQIRLLNSYGPTEATIVATLATPDQDDCPMSGILPIGRPIDNVQVYVLDSWQQLVPIGIPGELYIGGDGLARGYLNRPELTARRFIRNPFQADSATRLYRTGDMVRYRADGTLEFLGRTDGQVKVRGFRIELGEIESVLSQHPDVQQAVVVARDAGGPEKQLVAYVVGAASDPATLRAYLVTRLPDYMLPSAFVALDSLPLTTNGKIDRQALPAPQSASLARAAYTAAQTPTEQALVAIWQNVLGLDQIGLHDNFFALGGHSLQIMHLISDIADTTAYPVTVKEIFAYPTIAALAAQIAQPATHPLPEPTRIRGNHDTRHSQFSTGLTIESRPLLSLFATGKLCPIDAATLSTLPFPGLTPALLQSLQISRQEVIHAWYDNLPIFDELLETHLGNTAILTLPWFDDQLYQNQAALVDSIVEALELARQLGARVVSLAGLIPSATAYGRAILTALGNRPDLPAISTGHATTTATIVFAISRMLAESGRDLTREHVAFLGVGSIGLATLRLALHCLPHPQTITLCDIYQRRADLEHIQHELRQMHAYQGTIHIVESRGTVPADVYRATMIIGATNIPDILDVHKLQPGSLIIDDSAPHCFHPGAAVERFEARQDILFTEGGVLHAPQEIRVTRYLPRIAQRLLPEHVHTQFAWYNPSEITGCILSGLLSAQFAHLQPTIGSVDLATSVQHYNLLTELGFRGSGLHCEEYVLPAALIEQFRRHFG